MTTTKYMIGLFGGIGAIEVVKETEHFVTYMTTWNGQSRENRIKKSREWSPVFDTFEQARAHLIQKAENAIRSGLDDVERNRKLLARYQALTIDDVVKKAG